MRLFKKICGSILVIGGILVSMEGQVWASNLPQYPVLPNFSHVEEDVDDFHTSPIQNDEEALIFIKHRMLNRRAEINLKLSKELKEDIYRRFLVGNPEEEYAKYLIAQVVKHTGVPTEGDYLRNSYNFVTISTEVYNEDTVIKIRFNFYVNTEKEKMVDQKIKELLSETGELGYINHDNVGDFEKVRAIFNWITENMRYDKKQKKHSAYHGLIEGETICQGFSSIFYRLCLELGIDCRIIIGHDGEEHAWNIVKIGELYYNIDTTFGLGCKEDEEYHFFLLGHDPKGKFFGNERRVLQVDFTTEEFRKAYPMSMNDYNYRLENVKYSYMKGELRDSTKPVTGCNSGKAGYNVRWSYENGTLKLSGVGAIYDYEQPELVPWHAYATQINKIVIENGITYIGKNVFVSTNLTKDNENVLISPSVVSISKDAFLNEMGSILGTELPMSKQYEPVLREYVALDKGDPLVQPETMVLNKESDSFLGIKLPKDTKIAWESEVDTTTIGKKSCVLSIQYPDSSVEKFTIDTIYVRETAYEEPAVQIRIVQEPYKTRYVQNIEKFNPTGMIIRLVDKNGNKQTLQSDQFEQYGIKFYTSIYQDTELKIGDTLSRGYVLVVYQNFSQDLWLIVEPDGNYVNPEGQDQEWEKGKELVDASIFIKNKYNLPDNTLYKFVVEQNSEVETIINTEELGIKPVCVCVQYPNGTKVWVDASITVVEKNKEENKEPEVVTKPEGTEVKEPEVVAKPEETEVKEPEVPTKPEETEVKEPEVVTKPEETEGKEPEVVIKPEETEVKEPEVVTKPEETEVKEPEVVAKPEENKKPEVTEKNDGNSTEIKNPSSTQNSVPSGNFAPVIAMPISAEPSKENVEKAKEVENVVKEEVKEEDNKEKSEVSKPINNKKPYLPSKQESEDIKKAKVVAKSKILYQKSKKKKNTTMIQVSTKKRYKITYSTTTKKIVTVNKRTGKVVAKKTGTAIIKVNFYNKQGKWIGSKTIKLKVKK